MTRQGTTTDHSVRILVAEDDVASQRLVSRLLQPYGIVDCVSDGRAAIEHLEQQYRSGTRYRLLCLDVMMPYHSGIEVLARFRAIEDGYDVPEESRADVIMITALDTQQVFLESFRTGSQWYITKPVNRLELEAVIEELGIQRVKK